MRLTVTVIEEVKRVREALQGDGVMREAASVEVGLRAHEGGVYLLQTAASVGVEEG